MNLIVMIIIFQVGNDMLPISRQDITSSPLKTLVYLLRKAHKSISHNTIQTQKKLTLAQVPVYNSATGA